MSSLSSRLFITDLDGTLLDGSGRISERDAQAIRAMRQGGVEVTVCTGRLYSGVHTITTSLELQAPIACADGAHIVRPSDGRSLVRVPLPEGVAGQVVGRATSLGLASFAFHEDTIVHDALGEPFLPYARAWSLATTRVETVLEHSLEVEPDAILGLLAIGREERVGALGNQVRNAHDQAVRVDGFQVGYRSLSSYWALLVRAGNVDKGTAVRWIASYCGVTPESVVVVGDWINDIPMMLAAGRSFAMPHAPAEVMAVATDVLRSDAVSGGAIAEAAERSGLL